MNSVRFLFSILSSTLILLFVLSSFHIIKIISASNNDAILGAFVAENQGTVRDIQSPDASLNSDRLSIELSAVPAPQAHYFYQGYFLNSAGGALACGPLTVADGNGTIQCDYPDHNLIATYHTLQVMQEATLFTLALPVEPLPAFRTLLHQASDTPEEVGYSVGLVQQAQILHQHAGFARDAANEGSLVKTRRHTEHVLNILYGEADFRYGDHDGDGVTTNPGDGYGLLAYSVQISQTMQSVIDSSDATANMKKRALEVQTILENIGPAGGSSWGNSLITKAEEVVNIADVADTVALTLQMTGLADRILNGEDLDDSGTIDPVPNEGSAQTAYLYSQRAVDYLLTDYVITKPISADINGTIRYQSATDTLVTDQLSFDLSGLPPLAAGQSYWVYLLDQDGVSHPMGQFTEAGGALTFNDGRNLVSDYAGLSITIGAKYAKTSLPDALLPPMRTILHQAEDTPSLVGYGVGLVQQAQKLRQHAGFVRDAVDEGSLVKTRRHAEHVLNILYGEADPRYGDQDGDGVPTNPGDGYGLLVYSDELSATIDIVDGVTDNATARKAQVQTVLTNLNGSTDETDWSALLIAKTKEILAATTTEETQPLASAIVGLADRILNGEDINDNDIVEPIAGEGGAHTAYLYSQHVTDYTLEPLFTPTPVPTEGPDATATPADTNVPEVATQTATKEPTSTGVPADITPESTRTPSGIGDSFEADDLCSQAAQVVTDSSPQRRSFHQQSDDDWAYFVGEAGREYLIEAYIPPNSNADVTLELYKECEGGATTNQNVSFSPGVRLPFTAPENGRVYLRALNNDPSQFGPDQEYRLSVRLVPEEETPAGALIIVAGRLSTSDMLESNIHNITNRVYQIWQNNGYPADRIRYLATDLNLNPDGDNSTKDVHALPSNANLQDAITNWAPDKASADRALTLYIMDHGDVGKLYLDKPRDEILRPADLDEWLDTVEAAVPGLKINVIIEACNSGSFITSAPSIGGKNRVVIASTSASALAFASNHGANFSDMLLDSLSKRSSLARAFEEASEHALTINPVQVAWMDDNGDSQPNNQDGKLARQRGFNNVGSLDSSTEKWSPYIAQAAIRPASIVVRQSTTRFEIEAQVFDDSQVSQAWAVIYPPSWQPPADSRDELSAEPTPLSLVNRGDGMWRALYGEFDEIGTYRILIHAQDDDGLRSPPRELTIQIGSNLYLPFIER